MDRASALLLAVQFFWAGWAASEKPLWHDEIYTVLVARLPDPGAVLTALGQGVDLHPPLGYWIAGLFDRLPLPEPIRLRVPSMLAYLAFLIGMRAVGRLWMGPPGGLLAVAAGCLTGAWVYSFECRPYALMLACAGGAVYGWLASRRGTRHALWLVAGSCLIATANHYFGVLIPLFVGFGEAAAMRLERQPLRPARWLALLAGAPPLLFPLLHWRELHAYQSGFWGQGIASALLSFQLLGWSAIPLVLALGMAIANRRRWAIPAPEKVLAVSLLATPIVVWVLSEAAGSGLAPYHSMVVTAGAGLVTVTVAAGLTPSAQQTLALVAAAAALLFLPFQAAQSSWWFRTGSRAQDLRQGPLPEARLRHPNLPVVVEYGAEFLALTYQSPQSGVLYVNEPDLARRYIQTDTTELAFSRLSRIAPLGLVSRQQLESWPKILVVPGARGWLRKYLKELGYSLSPINDSVWLGRRP